MSDSAKIDLENGIFRLAAYTGVPVRARRGSLFCAAPHARLQAMLAVYNAFFARENSRLFLQEDNDWLCWWAALPRGGGLAGPVYRPDLRIEIAWLSGKNKNN